MKTEIILCECGSQEHQVLIHTVENFEIGEMREAYLSIYLGTHKGWWKRLIHAARYICGYKSCYGAWDSVILTEEHIPQLQNTIDFLKKPRD